MRVKFIQVHADPSQQNNDDNHIWESELSFFAIVQILATRNIEWNGYNMYVIRSAYDVNNKLLKVWYNYE